jgi:hypothetical protein
MLGGGSEREGMCVSAEQVQRRSASVAGALDSFRKSEAGDGCGAGCQSKSNPISAGCSRRTEAVCWWCCHGSCSAHAHAPAPAPAHAHVPDGRRAQNGDQSQLAVWCRRRRCSCSFTLRLGGGRGPDGFDLQPAVLQKERGDQAALMSPASNTNTDTAVSVPVPIPIPIPTPMLMLMQGLVRSLALARLLHSSPPPARPSALPPSNESAAV